MKVAGVKLFLGKALQLRFERERTAERMSTQEGLGSVLWPPFLVNVAGMELVVPVKSSPNFVRSRRSLEFV